uniref:Dynein heavy chain, cytoplasmic n=1 Tax=Bombyx mori TaxID=7091 RepID=A0A8R2LZL3_BOMMO|nr:cytoplasmic dynein 2 heavy chain 1 isoform X3 [Bombyx mori]
MISARDFIISTIELYFDGTRLKLDEESENALSEFIYNSQTLLIQGYVHNDTLRLSMKLQNVKRSIVFYKIERKELTQGNSAQDINILTFSNNTAEILFYVSRLIFTPLISEGNDLYSSKLQKCLLELESVLRVVNYGKEKGNVNAIFTIEDEFEYWKAVMEKKDASKKEREMSSTFSEQFQYIIEELRSMQSNVMIDAREAAENIGGILDDIWRTTTAPYPSDRMVHVMDVIGHTICTIIQTNLVALDLWRVHDDIREIEMLVSISDCLQVVETWTSACRALTETYWPNYALHPWNAKTYIPQFCVNFQMRLKEVYEIKSVFSQLNKLLSSNEKNDLRVNQLLSPFQSVNVWSCNGPNPAWQAAVSLFSTSLRQVEVKVAEKLKPRLHNTSTKQMLYEFLRYEALIERPYVKQTLNNELEIFATSLVAMLKDIKNQIDSDETDVKMYQPPEMSPLVHRVQWAKQMEAKVKEIKICADKHLSEFSGCPELTNLATQLLKDLKEMYVQLHEEWCRELQAQAKNGSLQMSTDKPVVEFSGPNKMMVVNFNPRLVWAELEGRALAALGLAPPAALPAPPAAPAALAHARALQQVASFHNTLGERMIPSTKPMMLQAALDLSAIVQDQKTVYWDDVEQLANYTEKLKKMVLKLEGQNTYLTSQHMAIKEIVMKLINTELLAKLSEWKKGVKDIRSIIETVEGNGYRNTELWRSHWDWQLYKALECQYIKTLLSLDKHFAHIKVDLVLRGHKIRVQPPIEEIRVQHYHQLRRLVSLPAQFVGVQNNITERQSIFADIVDKHSWLGNKAVKKLEQVLSSLEQCGRQWTRRAALACVPDLRALCTHSLAEPEHWELNFKACKAYGQAVAKMTFDDEKIEWLSVGTATLRREFEAQARTLWACLISSLQTSCRTDASEVDAFVANVTVILNNKTLPNNSKDLTELSAKQHALQEKMPEMEKIVAALKKKGNMLRTWGGDTSIDGTIKEWQKTRELMLNHQQMFENQAEIVKASLNGEWENLNTSVEAFVSRWTQSKARLDAAHDVHYEEMADRCRTVFEAIASWKKFITDREELVKECEKFNMKTDIADVWQQGDKLFENYETLWTVFEKFNEEYESIAEQSWIVFQKKLHLLDEFTTKWSTRLEPYTVVTLFIQQELDRYSDITPLLKYLRGNDFTDRHWREVFNLLEMEYKKSDTLKVKDFLIAAANIKKHIKKLQVEEQQWIVCSVSGGGSPEACGPWEARLRAAHDVLRATHHAQRRWLYLEPILSNDEGELGTKFKKVDLNFRHVTRIIESDPRISAILQSTRLQPMLDSISEQLLACQSALNQYIDEKRSIFPRFYFLSDDDLLELLGQARAGSEGREVVMQSHLKKLFPGITGVRLGPGGMSVTALCSHFGEVFQLDHPIDIDCAVEVWLKNLENEIRSSLQNMTLKCLVTNSLHEQDPFSLPTQILCLAQNIRFTEQAERAINSKELHKFRANVEKENLYYAEAETDDENERLKRQALILQCAYYLSVIKILIDNNVTSTSEWIWRKQFRFYLLNTKEVVARMGLAQIPYSYEYLGTQTGQFVRTEVADECFLILTQALHLGFVGNPFGPAGTGKTESVKALGGLVGRLVLVFNCDEAMDAECMGRLLTGLALSGAWGCFDEFNRLTSDTLAAVTHQFSSLLSAMTHRTPGTVPTASLNGKNVSVSVWCGVAATLNPSSRGYGGRRALPPALRPLLRPVAARPAAPRLLAAQLFAARSLPHAERLAADLHDVFTLASALLSGQRHYDWGLRALKAVAGGVRAGEGAGGERVHAARLLAVNNVSKLTAPDARIFHKILSLVFADVKDLHATADPIVNALEGSVQNLKLVENKAQLQKCIELYEQLQQRMGVVVVGPPASGKSTIRRLLKTALLQQGKTIMEYVISPKAMSRDWLLGHIDPDTRQWTDGVISATALEISNQPPDVWSWVVCDGDIDPEWIESLNSVLDDNRLLTLPSGWRVQFGNNVNFIFETHSLEHASPATISRMGIILMSDDVSCELDVLRGWVRRADHEAASPALPLLQRAVAGTVQWLHRHQGAALTKLYNVAVVRQILTQFEYLVQTANAISTQPGPEEMVICAIQRSVVDLLKEAAVPSFYDEISSVLGPPPPEPPSPNEWVSESLYMSARLLAVESVVRACLASDSSHLLIVGPDACAKSALVEHILKESNSPVITIDCTPILEPADIIRELKRHNVARSGGGGAVHSGARTTLYVRGLQRARADAWGSCPVHSFLLQLLQQGGWWSEAAAWCAARRVLVLAAATAPPAPRLATALARAHLADPDEDELLQLATNYLTQSVDKNISAKEITSLASKMLSLFQEVTEIFNTRPHYKWNASHLKKWCENVKWYNPKNTEDLLTAIVSEANFIFRDRFVTDEEKLRFSTMCRGHLKNDATPVHYTYKLRGDGVYLETIDRTGWRQYINKLINQCLAEHEYNIFGDSGVEVCDELNVLCPAMARAANGGIVVCVGTAGVGRAAASRLVCAALQAALYPIDNPSQFNGQFKNALSSSGDATHTLVVLSESAANSATIACIEALIRARSLNAIPEHMLPGANNPHMLDNIKQCLGIVICLDKNQSNLAELIEKYPILYNQADLIWLEKWSEETLRDVPSLIIDRLLKENVTDITKDQLEKIPIDGFVKIHKSLETDCMRAPCRYVNFVKTYFYIMSRKKTALVQRQNTLSAGLDALKRARTEVATLQTNASKQEAELSDKQAKANQALDQISATVRATTDRKEEMHALKKNIEIENEKLQKQKEEIEAELASVEPVIAAARAAVGDIRPESLSEVRSLRAPPDVVRDVLEGVLRLMGIADTSWHSMKNFLAKRGVKEDIRCLDASQISPAAIEGVKKLLERRGASFEAAAARRASAACAPLAAWVRANLRHADALVRVRPLQDKQATLHKNLQEAEDQLSTLSSGLATVDERVAALKEQLGRHSRDAAALELSVASAAQTIAAATQLLDQLAHEYTAWERDLANISTEISQLSVRSLLAAAYVVYLPDLTEPQALVYIHKWSKFVGFDDSSFSVINFLSTTEKQLKWDADGLPADSSAVKNAVLIDQVLEAQKCGLTPFLIDPDGEGMTWLKNTLADQQCDFVSQNSEKLSTAVQYAIRLGRILVITEAEHVAEAYGALACGRRGAAARVLLHCRDVTAPARLPPHQRAALSLLHFTARLDGLTDQLVHYALQQQNPDMNEKLKEIKIQKATYQKQQHELQENLLRDLSGNVDILHDANLLASLNRTRAANAAIREALDGARALEAQSRGAGGAHAAAARRTARLALAVRRVAERRPLVALPVDAVLEMFADALRTLGQKSQPKTDDVIKYVTRRIIERVLLGLYKKDNYIIVLHLLKEVYDELMPDKLWNLLVSSNDVLEDTDNVNEIRRSYPWIPDGCVRKVAKLKITDENLFNKLCLNKEDMWREFLESGDSKVISKLGITPFEYVVSVASVRPDGLYRALVEFVDQALGAGVMSCGSALGVAGRSAGRGGARRPVLLRHAHARDLLLAHAQANALPLTLVGIEEGKNSWNVALEATRSGGWLAIDVGASPFTTEIQTFISEFVATPPENLSDDFRMWILSEDRDIPALLCNACINVILETPEGVKNNIMSTLAAWGNYEAEPNIVRLHASLAVFHALVQERQAYIPQGWSRRYGWEWGEVRACAGAVRRAGTGGAALWGALYASRVSAPHDRRALQSLRHHAARPDLLPLPLPATSKLQAYVSFFDKMSDVDSPQLLGLPDNCGLARERTAANDIIIGLKELNTTVSPMEKSNSVASLKSLLALWKKLMAGSPLLKSDYVIEEKERQGWWAAACGAELHDARRAARAVHAALAQRARSGAPLHKVPDEWQLLWLGPDAPDAYIKELCHRVRSALERFETLTDEMPKEVDLRSFLRPSRVVWALLVRAAEGRNCSVDTLMLAAKWNCPEESPAGDSVRLRGVQLSGCECGAAGVQPAPPRAPPHRPAPPLHVRCVSTHEDSSLLAEGVLEVPVYSNESREELVFEMRVPLARSFSAETATLHTVAMFIGPVD